MERKYIESFVFLALLLGTFVLAVIMALPYLNMLALAAIFAFLLSGPYERLTHWVRNRSFAAFLMTIAVFIVILAPLSLAGYQIAHEATSLYTTLREQASGQSITVLLEQIQSATRSVIPTAQIDAQAISEWLQQILQWIAGHLGDVFTGATRLVLGFAFFLLFFYYLVKDGGRLTKRVMEISPLSDVHERQILNRIALSVSGTIRGQVILSVLQGIMASLGFLFFNVPNPLLWGSLAMLASFIPFVGTSLITVPSVLYLGATGQWTMAAGLLIWAMIAVGLLDNFLGPKLMSQGTRLHPLVMLIAVLGGISLFGPIGILIGPIIMSMLFALFDIYLSLFRNSTTH